MLEITTTAQLDSFIRSHPKAFVAYTRRGSPLHSDVVAFARQLQEAYSTVEVAVCITDSMTRTGYAQAVRVLPSFAAYRAGTGEQVVEGPAAKRALAACEALGLVD